jgi:O-antigen ligase
MVVRASAVFDYCNTFAYFLVVALGAALWLLREERDRYWREFLVAAIALALWALWLTYSRGAWLALAVGLAAAGAYHAVRRRSAGSVGLAATLALVALVAALATRAGERTPAPAPLSQEAIEPFPGAFSPTPADTLETRKLLWRAAVANWRSAPWFGVGVDRFRYTFYDRLPRVNYDLFVGQGLYQPHNLALTALSTQGLVGLLALGAFLAGLAIELRRTQGGAATFGRAIAMGMLAVSAAANVYDAMMFDSYVNMLLTTLTLALVTTAADHGETALD